MWVLRGAVEGGKWGKGEGSVDWVPPVHPLKDMLNINLHQFKSLSNASQFAYTTRCQVQIDLVTASLYKNGLPTVIMHKI